MEDCPTCGEMMSVTQSFGSRGVMTRRTYRCIPSIYGDGCGFTVTDEFGTLTDEQLDAIIAKDSEP